MHLAQLRPDGSLAGVPEGAHLVLEIGANTRNTLDRAGARQAIARLEEAPGHAAVADALRRALRERHADD